VLLWPPVARSRPGKGFAFSLAACLVFAASVSAGPFVLKVAAAPVVSNFTGPGINTPVGIATGPDGALWFTNYGNNSIGRIDTSGAVSNYTDPSINSPVGIATGPDGALWFTNPGTVANPTSSIGRISTAGVVTNNFTDPSLSLNFQTRITTGPDGAMWFTNYGNNSIGRISTAGVVTNFTGPGVIGVGGGITTGPDGALWFTNNGGSIGRITTAGAVSIFTDPSIIGPLGITTGPDGALWFADPGGNSIDRMTTAGVVTNRYTDPSLHGPGEITNGPDGALWFTNYLFFGPGIASIGRITTAGVVSNFTDPSINAPLGITTGPDGAMWFTNYGNNSIGRIDLGSPTLPPITITNVVPGNGSVTVSWTTSPVYTSYVITAVPAGNNREHPPLVGTASRISNGPSGTFTFPVGSLIEDCHQAYSISVTPLLGSLAGPVATWTTSVRPSGNVQQGVAPPYVVILLDGISSSQPGFSDNAFQPTSVSTPSYCPESFTSPSLFPWNQNDFKLPPNGPGEFFAKWNFYDLADNANGNEPATQSNSTPLDLGTGSPSNEFMLDAIAAQGAIILPYSYMGVTLSYANGQLLFKFNPYTRCNSTPVLGGAGCNNLGTAHGFEHPTLNKDEATLRDEINQVQTVLPSSKVVVLGHSQGGLIAWNCNCGYRNPGGVEGFSLDSPINGVEVNGHDSPYPAGYPKFSDRYSAGSTGLAYDNSLGDPLYPDPFRFVGTWGDSPTTKLGPITLNNAYGGPYSDETLQHQLLVTGSQCNNQGNITSCPSPPDHVSGCSISSSSPAWVRADAHFIVKFCPDDVAYFNRTLGLNY
jgi:virginiamycin B lyase